MRCFLDTRSIDINCLNVAVCFHTNNLMAGGLWSTRSNGSLLTQYSVHSGRSTDVRSAYQVDITSTLAHDVFSRPSLINSSEAACCSAARRLLPVAETVSGHSGTEHATVNNCSLVAPVTLTTSYFGKLNLLAC